MSTRCKSVEPGTQFGRWTVLASMSPRPRPDGKTPRPQVRARCKCGVERTVLLDGLRSGTSRSCGCLQRETMSQMAAEIRHPITHGHTAKARGRTSPTYRTWTAMRTRCSSPKHPHYSRYGGRGIIVCERWNSFENFLADMGERPDGRTLDRIDNDGNYEPGNCRWATAKEQGQNRSRPTHCPHGHLFDRENTYLRPDTGARVCRMCRRERRRSVLHVD